MLMVGLTGGIGAGKSAVAARLATHGAVLIDADQLSRAVVAPGTPGLAEVVALFGPAVLGEDGRLDRAAIGALVFGDRAARRALEAIIHPRVLARSTAIAAGVAEDAVVVNDVPLLVEAGLSAAYDVVVVVRAASELRIQRLLRDRGLSEPEVLARMGTQATDQQRAAVADIVIDNDGSYEALLAAADEVWRELRSRADAR
ncbi:MAG: dephospho-CoA kinase, long form [Dactylosporangium sp.]|nr:dephospho-CoA kinase, long form [Dactylosporangium sp.]